MTSTVKTSNAACRTQAQCARILCAAQSCFVRSGFHNASMASIADAAGMSPGLIYRYFENKNAIILAIIEQQLVESRERIRELRSTDDLVDAILEYFDALDSGNDKFDSAALFLEMSAEATRDPEIAAALHRFDTAIRSEISDWLSRDPAKGGYALDRSVAPERALGLVCLIEGLKLRKVREPEIDRAILKRTIDLFVQSILRP